MDKLVQGVNEVVFIGGILGIVAFLLKTKTSYLHKVAISGVFFFIMVFWRIYFAPALSSRYFAILIFPFSILTSYYIVSGLKVRHKACRFFVILTLIVGFLAITNKIISTSVTDHMIFNLANAFQNKLRTRNNYKILLNEKELERIKHYTPADKGIIRENTIPDDEIVLFDKKYITTYYTTLVHTVSKEIKDSEKLKMIVSLNNPKNLKKHQIFAIEPHSKCKAISLSEVYKDDLNNSLLQNGDLEILDSEEESFSKFCANVSDYASYYNESSKARTAQNMCFRSSGSLSSMPVFTVSEEDAIAGHSAVISYQDGLAYLMFNQRFHNGKYKYSITLKGEKNTDICLVCRKNKKKHWELESVALFKIPDKRLFHINTTFNVNDLEEKEYFIVGVWVKNGYAVLDNFYLEELNTNQ